MSSVSERVDGWSSRPFDGGIDGLRDLADEEFSGTVELDAGPRLYMLNGRVVGVFDGTLDDFEGATGERRRAPDPGVALLGAMQETGGSLEEQYYTKDTAISEADDTLSAGSFTGYVELSENVLSGDYYVCYYGGTSTSVAYVGNNDRLITGEEAFERADDEVGIYDVYSVDLEVVDLPDPETTTDTTPAPASDSPGPATADTDAAGEATDPRTATDRGTDDPRRRDHPGAPDDGRPADAGATGERPAAVDPAADDSRPGEDGTTGGTGPSIDLGPDESSGEESPPRGVREPTDDAGETATGPRGDGRRPDDRPRAPDAGVDDTSPPRDAGGADRGETPPPGRSPEPSPDGDSTADSRADTAPGVEAAPPEDSRTDASPGRAGGRETDPVETADPSGGADGEGGPADGARASVDDPERREPAGGEPAPGQRRPPARSADDGRSGDPRFEGEAQWRSQRSVPSIDPDSEGVAADLSAFEDRLDGHEATLDRLRGRVESVERAGEDREDRVAELRAEVESVATDLRELRRTVVRLDETVDRVERRLEAADAGEAEQAASGDGTGRRAETTGVELDAERALRETTLLVRYGSRGAPTLETAHAGEADRAAVNDNLRLDAHPSFDADAASVDGRPFQTFLAERMEYQFVEWLVREFPYEVRETGNAAALGDLYDALPEVDRAEIREELTVEREDGETETVTFDVVVRDAVGTPLVAANFNDSREPATREMVVDLQERATTVAGAADLRAAVLVTASFFAPEAQAAVEEATGGSLLSRDSRKSFVKVSRKDGYHFCLVESRDGDFHVNVPEL
jgi:hypothetical protein